MNKLAFGLCLFLVLLLFALFLGPVHAGEAHPAHELATVDIDLSGQHVAILITKGFHDAETIEPRDYLTDRGADVTVIGEERGEFTAYNSDETVEVEKTVVEVEPEDFDALLIPGGQSPGQLRENEDVIAFVREFVELKRVTAAICHGPQVLVTAGVLEGVTATCFSGMSGELQDADADYVDRSVVRDGQFITSRVPGDIPDYNQEIGRAMSKDIRQFTVGYENDIEVIELEIIDRGESGLKILWQKEDPAAQTHGDALIEKALAKAAEEHDPDERYTAMADPDFQKINQGEWEKAGYASSEEAAVGMLKMLAMTGFEAPEPDPQDLEKTFVSTLLFQEHFTGEERRKWAERYYAEDEERKAILHSPDPGAELEEFTAVEMISYRFPEGDLWISAAEIDDLEPGELTIVARGWTGISERMTIEFPLVE